MSTSSLSFVVGSFELALAAVGAVLLWRMVVRPAVRIHPAFSRLPEWNVPVTDFLVFLVCVISGSIAIATSAMLGAKYLNLRGDEVTVFNGAAAQLGMLAGVGLY